MAENYFRLTSLADGNQISIKAVGSPTAVNLQYRTSLNQTWQTYAIGTLISISTNEWIEFRNDTGTFSSGNESTWEDYYNVTMTKAADASGSIMSLLDYNNMDMAVPEWAFYGLFRFCSTLRNPPELPATSIGYRCYNNMFSESGVIRMPTLPATTLQGACYDSMFRKCPNLVEVSELPATTLTNACYYGMFKECTSLTQVPALPATTLASYCYQAMFEICTSLTQAPELPATTLAEKCYQGMFQSCKSLTTPPELPATNLATGCYDSMFFECSSLTQAPELPATTIAISCYNSMFFKCSSLTTPPALPATTLDTSCYDSMFYECTSLTQAPELPATTLATGCYNCMFFKCSSLTAAPELPATTLAGRCYASMFQNCPKIDRIVWKSTTIPSKTYCGDWLSGTSSSGTFEYTEPTLDVASITRNSSGVPAGWSIILLSPETKLLLKINNASVDSISLLGKKIASLSINGKPVKSSSSV